MACTVIHLTLFTVRNRWAMFSNWTVAQWPSDPIFKLSNLKLWKQLCHHVECENQFTILLFWTKNINTAYSLLDIHFCWTVCALVSPVCWWTMIMWSWFSVTRTVFLKPSERARRAASTLLHTGWEVKPQLSALLWSNADLILLLRSVHHPVTSEELVLSIAGMISCCLFSLRWYLWPKGEMHCSPSWCLST